MNKSFRSSPHGSSSAFGSSPHGSSSAFGSSPYGSSKLSKRSALVVALAATLFGACGDSSTSDGSATTSTSAASGSSTGTGSSADCKTCLQTAAVGATCKAKLTTCLNDQGHGGAGGACTSCNDWTTLCAMTSETVDQCKTAEGDLCSASHTLGADLETCICAQCMTECGASCQ